MLHWYTGSMSEAPKTPASWKNHLTASWATCVAVVLERKDSDAWIEIHRVEIPEPRGDQSEAVRCAEDMWSRALGVADEEGGVIEFRIGVALPKGILRWCARSGRVDVGGASPRIVQGELDGGAGLLRAHTAATTQWKVALEARDNANEKLSNVLVNLAERLAGILDKTAEMMSRNAGAEAKLIESKFNLEAETVRANAHVASVEIDANLKARRMERAASFAEKFGPALIPSAIAWFEAEARKAQSATAENIAAGWRLLSVAVRAAGERDLADAIASCKREATQREFAKVVLEWTQPIRASADSPDLLADVQRWARWVLAAPQS